MFEYKRVRFKPVRRVKQDVLVKELPTANIQLEVAPPKKRDYLIKKGEVRNPKGRPKGSHNKTTLLLNDILANNKDKLLKTAIKMANEGNAQVLCKLLDKILPTITETTNINKGITFEDFVLNQLKRLNYQRQNQLSPTAQPINELSQHTVTLDVTDVNPDDE